MRLNCETQFSHRMSIYFAFYEAIAVPNSQRPRGIYPSAGLFIGEAGFTAKVGEEDIIPER